MYSDPLDKKRSISPSHWTSPSEAKRRKTNYDSPALPTLHVDCTVPSRPPPQLLMYPSPQPQPDLYLPLPNITGCSAELAEHSSQVQQSTTYYGWDQYPRNSEPSWTAANYTYNTSTEFTGLCETSVTSSTSFASSISNTQNPFRDPPKTLSACPKSPFAERVNAARDMFIASIVPVLTRLRENLAQANKDAEELHGIASVLLAYGAQCMQDDERSQ
jgi:hypothetical protein